MDFRAGVWSPVCGGDNHEDDEGLWNVLLEPCGQLRCGLVVAGNRVPKTPLASVRPIPAIDRKNVALSTEDDLPALCEVGGLLFAPIKSTELRLSTAMPPSLPCLPSSSGDGLHVDKVSASLSIGLPPYSGTSASHSEHGLLVCRTSITGPFVGAEWRNQCSRKSVASCGLH